METTYKTKTGTQMIKFILFMIVGFVLLFVGLGISVLFNILKPSLTAEYENANIFRPWTDPIMSIYWIMPFVTSFLLMWLWNFSKSLIKGNSIIVRGMSFGFFYWIITVPGLVMTYSTFQVSAFMVISWSLSALAQSLCAGIIFARLQP